MVEVEQQVVLAKLVNHLWVTHNLNLDILREKLGVLAANQTHFHEEEKQNHGKRPVQNISVFPFCEHNESC
jgi:ADP-glucose pyrophosphorylase